MIIEYSRKGIAVSDFELGDYVADIGLHDHVIVSTENVLFKIKELIAKGQLPHDRVVFLYEGKEIHPNKYGATHNTPDGFMDTIGNIAEETMMAAYKKSKRKS